MMDWTTLWREAGLFFANVTGKIVCTNANHCFTLAQRLCNVIVVVIILFQQGVHSVNTDFQWNPAYTQYIYKNTQHVLNN